MLRTVLIAALVCLRGAGSTAQVQTQGTPTCGLIAASLAVSIPRPSLGSYRDLFARPLRRCHNRPRQAPSSYG